MNTATKTLSSNSTAKFLPAQAAFRIAIVGCGPRGLYCLERLSRLLRGHRCSGAVSVDIFEPSSVPGAGTFYDPSQPHFLRMNVPSSEVDAWHPDPQERYHGDLTLVEWLVDRYPEHVDPHSFIPRAIVGEYYQWCLERVIRDLRDVAPVTFRREKADHIEQAGGRWRIYSGSSFVVCDEVMLTIGREGRASSAENGLDLPGPIVEGIYPVKSQLSSGEVASDCRVAIRGFGLEWIDAALALTEGRDGRFSVRDDRWSYQRSGKEPVVLCPISRTGRPVLARPLPHNEADLLDLWDEYHTRLVKLPKTSGGHRFRTDIWPLITEAADKALRAATGRTRVDTAGWFRGWSRWRISGELVAEKLRQSFEIATGQREMDEAWALGKAWRHLFPTLVKQLSHGGLASDSWSRYRRVQREMERIAHGAPAESIGRILALHDEGLVDFNFLSGSQLMRSSSGQLRLERFDQRREIDRVVIAERPRRQYFCLEGILGDLVQSEIAAEPEAGRGFNIDRGGRLRGPEDSFVQGIALIGPATEGCVLGSGTLSRRLHHHLDCWTHLVDRQYLQRRISA